MSPEKTALAGSIEELGEFWAKFHKDIANFYYNSQPVVELETSANNGTRVPLRFHLTDVLLIGAITQSSILLSGSSGSGKTYLAELISEYIFGPNGYARKNITPDMNEQDFMDIDFGAIKEGKKLKEALQADELFARPVLIIDEANRAPPIIQNRLMQILENNVDLKSKKVQAGPTLPNGQKYHWNLLTLNLGAEYAGTSQVDRALRDRIVLEIPIDNFPPKILDQIKMIRRPLYQKPPASAGARDDLIFNLFLEVDDIGLSLEGEALLLYLSFTSNCVKSPTGSKYGVNFSPQYCKDHDCQYARNPPLSEICPFTFAPSNRVLRKLVHVAKGFWLLKQAQVYARVFEKRAGGRNQFEKYLDETRWEVSVEDILAIAPLVLHSKVSMNRQWVLNKFNGNIFLATKHYLAVINDRLVDFMRNLLPGLVADKTSSEISERDKGIRNRAVRKDFHFSGLINYVRKFLQ
ncbi:MAG: AAA family ATPase [Promethearchaeota archaeon]